VGWSGVISENAAISVTHPVLALLRW
jgi:hypothetical protein